MAQTRQEWLNKILAANGFSLDDLSNQTGISKHKIEKIASSENADKDEWNAILTTINTYPALDYPSGTILEQIKSDIDNLGIEARCIVYYGVNAGNLIFCDYKAEGDLEEHGANVPLEFLSQLNLSLQEAYELFRKQNFITGGADTPE